MASERQCFVAYVAAFAAVLVPCADVFADAYLGSATIIEVTATSGGHSATFEETYAVGSFDSAYSWALPVPTTLKDGANDLVTLQSLSVTYDASGQVDFNFSLTNDSLVFTTLFFRTAEIIFETGIPDAQAAASAALTLTQGAGSPLGGSLTGQLNGTSKAYQARYGTSLLGTADTNFASLCPPMILGPGQLSTSEWQQQPGSGLGDLNEDVYIAEIEFNFILSAGDQASGSSAFLLVPEPTALSILAFGGLFVLRRRRAAA